MKEVLTYWFRSSLYGLHAFPIIENIKRFRQYAAAGSPEQVQMPGPRKSPQKAKRGKGALPAAQRAAERAAAALRKNKRNDSEDELVGRSADKRKKTVEEEAEEEEDEEEDEEEEEEEEEEEGNGDIEINEVTQTVKSKSKVSFDYFILPLLVLILCFERRQKGAASATVQIEKGPFAIFEHRPNATNLQRFIVPWLIASYGLSYPKTIDIGVLKEMLIAIIDQNKLLGPDVSCAVQSRLYPVGFQDLVKKVKNAAGLSCVLLWFASASS